MAENVKIYTMDQFLKILSDDESKLVEKLRSLITSEAPRAEEMVMWSTPWYKLRNRPFVYIATTSDHLNFGFAFGAHLRSKLLEGTGKNMRHIKIFSIKQFEEQENEYKKLLKEASTLK